MSAQHTPGPWEHVRLSGTCGPNAIRMAYNAKQTFYGVRVVARAEDAQLIAAAPDLLEALLAVNLARHTDAPADWQRATDLSDAAIAKARGDVA